MCRHSTPDAVNVDCFMCVRERKHVGRVIEARLREVTHDAGDIDCTVEHFACMVNDALNDLYLPYGFRARALLVEDEVSILVFPPHRPSGDER